MVMYVHTMPLSPHVSGTSPNRLQLRSLDISARPRQAQAAPTAVVVAEQASGSRGRQFVFDGPPRHTFTKSQTCTHPPAFFPCFSFSTFSGVFRQGGFKNTTKTVLQKQSCRKPLQTIRQKIKIALFSVLCAYHLSRFWTWTSLGKGSSKTPLKKGNRKNKFDPCLFLASDPPATYHGTTGVADIFLRPLGVGCQTPVLLFQDPSPNTKTPRRTRIERWDRTKADANPHRPSQIGEKSQGPRYVSLLQAFNSPSLRPFTR
jgi:hypothetical protein